MSATVLWWSYGSKLRNCINPRLSIFSRLVLLFFPPAYLIPIPILYFFPPEACGSKSVYDGPEEEEYSTFIIDDPKETYKTLKLIIEGVGTLEQEHAQYKRDKFKKTKYGSQ